MVIVVFVSPLAKKNLCSLAHSSRVQFSGDLYEQTLDVSCMDISTGTMYMFAVSDLTQDVYLVGVDTSSWIIRNKVPTPLQGEPVAMEFYGNNIIVTVEMVNGTSMWLEVNRVNPVTGSATRYATISPNWPSTLGASAMDPNTGVLYLGVGNAQEPPTLWRVATISPHDGSVSFSQAFARPILSLLGGS